MARVYVSSTIRDLEAERRAVMVWLVTAGHQPVHSYRPDSKKVRESCLNDIDTCDLYVLILGHRYGFVPEDDNPEKLSITHLEFRRAGLSSIPRIALLQNNVPDMERSDLKNPAKSLVIFGFREEVGRTLRPALFTDGQQLIEGLSTGVQSELDKLRVPSGRARPEAWRAHLEDVSARFGRHMAASELNPGTRPQSLYLDLLVTERKLDRELNPEHQRDHKDTRPLHEVLNSGQSPLLLLGEGGAGKTTSLLYVAAQAADRARTDEAAVVPIYVNLARLTKIEDVPDLLQLIADSAPHLPGGGTPAASWVSEHRRFLFLFDSFNEIPEKLQRTSVVVLQRFIETHGDRHTYVVGTRLLPHVEQLARPPATFKAFEILRLTPDQVRTFLEGLGLGSLFDRMPRELRELAGNPFILLAVARTLAGAQESTLPRNLGMLYQRFARGWIANEGAKRRLDYSYERVKEPLLAYLAKRMTAAGQTSLGVTEEVEDGIQSQLEGIHQRIRRRGGMPEDWTVDRCLDEVVADGLLRRVNDHLYFMHQSVQEYFTALYFKNASPEALVDFTPKLLWESMTAYRLAEVPNHRFVPALLMMSGLLNDSTKIVEALLPRNSVLAAAATSAASRVDGSLLAKLEESWLGLLEHDDLRHRIVGCSSLALGSIKSSRVIQRLVGMAIEDDLVESRTGVLALERMDSPDAIAREIVNRALGLSDAAYESSERRFGRAVKELNTGPMVRNLFERWRVASVDSTARARVQGLLASADSTLLSEELRRIGSAASDPSLAMDAERVLTAVRSWQPAYEVITSPRRLRQRWETQFHARMAEAVTRLSRLGDEQVTGCLRSTESAERAAAARVLAERRLPVVDAVLESLLRVDQGKASGPLLAALVALCGEQAAVAGLVEGARGKSWCVAKLDPAFATSIQQGSLSDELKSEIERLRVGVKDWSVVGKEEDGTTSVLHLSAWPRGLFPRRYELRASQDRVELHDCNVAARAFSVLAGVPGEFALTELQRALDHDDPIIQAIAVEALAERGDQHLAVNLMARLRSKTSPEFVDAALAALRKLRAPEAVSLVNELLLLSDGPQSDAHPVWGACSHDPGWGDAIHHALAQLTADGQVQDALDRALASQDPVSTVAALKEFSRWFDEEGLSPERMATWRRPERVEQLFRLALTGTGPSVRAAAAEAAGMAGADSTRRLFADALDEDSVNMQVAAGEGLVRREAHELYGAVGDAMLRAAKSSHSPELRRRAGAVLSAIPGGVAPIYHPIQTGLGRGEWDHALELIADAMQIIPEDVNLWWWRGHALRSLGRLEAAVESYQKAFEREEMAPVITQALSQTFLELGDSARAVEAARRGVEIAEGDADAQSMLAWSGYKAGMIREAVQAGRKALDLDPVHGDAICIVLLAHLRLGNPEEARLAFQHALRVRQLLSLEMNSSIVDELKGMKVDDPETLRLLEEIKQNLLPQQGG